jgi:hypothetical protein
MHPSSEPQPRQRRYSVRRQACLDVETCAKLEVLARTFHRKRAAILRYVMQWGLTHTTAWTIDLSIPDRPHLVHMLVDREPLRQAQEAADAHVADTAAWERHAMRQVTYEDFPASWRAVETAPRSHDSGYYSTRFMLRLDEATSRQLETLTQTFHRSAAEVIRQLIAQAKSEDFPPSWHLAVEKRRPREVRSDP